MDAAYLSQPGVRFLILLSAALRASADSGSMELQIDVIVSAPFMENTWIVRQADHTDCVVVDPGFQPKSIVNFLRAQRLSPCLILLTHGHADHIAGNAGLRQEWPDLPIVIGAGDAPMLTDAGANLSRLGGVAVTSPPADRLVAEHDVVSAAGIEFEVREIPGHSPGHVVYVVRSATPCVVLAGDVLFAGSIGRCDFPGGSQELLVRGIRDKLFSLPPETEVYPGHGDPTTIGREQRSNPFCGDEAGLFQLE